MHSNGMIDVVCADMYLITHSLSFYLFGNDIKHKTILGRLFGKSFEEVARFKSVTAIIRLGSE